MIIDLLEEEIPSFQFVTWLHVTTWSEDHVTSWVSYPHHKSGGHRLCRIGNIKLLICHMISRDYPTKFCGNRLCRRGDIVLYWSCDLTCPHGQWVMWYYGWLPLILSQHRAGPMSAFFKIHNLPVMTCADLWLVLLNNQLKRPFQLHTQVRTSKLELQKEP